MPGNTCICFWERWRLGSRLGCGCAKITPCRRTPQRGSQNHSAKHGLFMHGRRKTSLIYVSIWVLGYIRAFTYTCRTYIFLDGVFWSHTEYRYDLYLYVPHTGKEDERLSSFMKCIKYTTQWLNSQYVCNYSTVPVWNTANTIALTKWNGNIGQHKLRMYFKIHPFTPTVLPSTVHIW